MLPPPKSKSGIPFITISNITDYNQISFDDTMFVPQSYYDRLGDTKRCKKGDILYSVVGSFGKPVYIENDNKFVFQRHIAILRPNSSVNGKYIYYTLLNPNFFKKMDNVAIGCSQRTVTLDTLRNTEIDLPEKDIQDKIVIALDCIDDKIKRNLAINNNLQHYSSMVA